MSAPRFTRRFLRLGCVFCVCAFSATIQIVPAAEPEYIVSEKTAEETQKEKGGTLKEVLPEEKPEEYSVFPQLKARTYDLPPFWRDTKLSFRPRVYDFKRDRDPSQSGGTRGTRDGVAWAVGGALSYRSGWWRDRIAIGAAGYTTLKLYAPSDKDGHDLLKNGQTGFAVLGQAYLKARLFEGIEFRGGRQLFNLPYLNANDSRMVPITHEAYYVASNRRKNFDAVVGQVRKMKGRANNEFVYMTQAAGFPRTEDGLTFAGARYRFSETASVGVINYYSWNLMNTLYAEAYYERQFDPGVEVRFHGQFTNQHSVGDEIAGDFDVDSFGALLNLGWQGVGVSVAASRTDGDTNISKPYGGSPSVVSLMLSDFDRAEEDAWRVGLSYDFRHTPFHGLSAFANYADGDTPESGPHASPDQYEWDITFDYRPEFGQQKGWWLRARYGSRRRDGGQDVTNLRIILNWTLPIL